MEETQERGPEVKEASAQSDKKKWIIIGIVVVLLIVAAQSLLFSPERMIERSIEQAGDGEYDVDVDEGGSMRITGEDGEEMNIEAGGTATLPGGWPNSIPIIPDAKIGYSAEVNDKVGGMGLTVTFETARSVSEVLEFYKQELGTNGWTIEATMASGQGSVLSASKESGEGVAVYIGASDGVTGVTITTQTVE